MPNFKDFLPQPPWEGPPIPRGWTKSTEYERRVRIELRKLPTDKLKLVYNGLIAGFPSRDIPLLNEDKEVSARVAKEVLWERGKLPGR